MMKNTNVRLWSSFRGSEKLEWYCPTSKEIFCKDVMEMTGLWAAIRRTKGDEAVLENKKLLCSLIAKDTHTDFTVEDLDQVIPAWLQREGNMHLDWSINALEANMKAFENNEEIPYKSVSIFGHINEKIIDKLIEFEEGKEDAQKRFNALSEDEKDAARKAGNLMHDMVFGNQEGLVIKKVCTDENC